MTTEANANPGTADAAAGTQASAADAVKAPVGTPATDQKVAEATAGETPKNGEPVNWEQKATYWEAEAKKIAGQRDAAKKTWLGSDDGKKFAAELASLKTAKTQWEKSQQDKAEAESAQKGEFEKLYQGAKTKSDELTAKVADLEGTATAKEAAWTGRMIRAEAKASIPNNSGSLPCRAVIPSCSGCWSTRRWRPAPYRSMARATSPASKHS